jgi:predicted CXXCH cytochrome family protein
MTRQNPILTGLALASLGLMTASATAQIVGSAHDFSSMAWSGGQICKPCHTPHNAMTGMPRLWNHELTVATYQMHEGSGGTGTGTAVVDFDYRSRMCLSCHDGTVALDSFGGSTGTSFIPGSANLGTDLRNDHPVGADALYPPNPVPTWWSGAFKDASLLPSALRLQNWTDPGGTVRKVVGCTTCHNPHRTGGYPDLLTMSNAASAVCLGCHIK